jgi:hypothetical protein
MLWEERMRIAILLLTTLKSNQERETPIHAMKSLISIKTHLSARGSKQPHKVSKKTALHTVSSIIFNEIFTQGASRKFKGTSQKTLLPTALLSLLICLLL